MTKSCVICQKTYVPGDKSCSFHRFPTKDDLRKKWLDAIGKTCVGKNAHICSDHFCQHSFRDTDGYISKRRLLYNTVPIPIRVTRNVLGDNGNTITSNDCSKRKHAIDRNNHASIKNIDKMDLTQENNASKEMSLTSSLNNSDDITANNDTTPILLQSNQNAPTTKSNSQPRIIQVTIPKDENNVEIENNIFEKKDPIDKSSGTVHEKDIQKDDPTRNLKRKPSMLDYETAVPDKKIRFMYGFQTKYISRADFVSHEAWQRFLMYNIVKNRQAGKHRLQKMRRQKKIRNMMQLISTLQEK